jgi:hypothetical protein
VFNPGEKTSKMLHMQHFVGNRTLMKAILRPSLVFTILIWGAFSEAAEKRVNLSGLEAWRKPNGEWMTAKAVSLNPTNAERFAIRAGKGILVNGPNGKSVDLVSEQEFGDIEAHVEFCIPKHSNSGVYLMGRYEIQVYDSYGVEKDKYPGIECGGIYPRWINQTAVDGHSPRINASKPPGEWQSFDITFRAPRFDSKGHKIGNAKVVKVVHNGKVIHENVELNGPTRGAMAEDEKSTGPIRLQGDHGPVAYRNLRVKRLG